VAKPLRSRRRGRVVLIGDAAHAMLPHHGQGANVTIEDAVTLAELIAETPDIGATLDAYESLRKSRARKIQRASWAGNHALHLPDGAGIAARNERLAAFPKTFGWIHAFDALEAVRAAYPVRRSASR
jgi:salicylate hydroxylase